MRSPNSHLASQPSSPLLSEFTLDRRTTLPHDSLHSCSSARIARKVSAPLLKSRSRPPTPAANSASSNKSTTTKTTPPPITVATRTTTRPASTSSYLRPTASSRQRKPLHSRDHNVVNPSRPPPIVVATATSKRHKDMPLPHDKPGAHRQPVLSASAAKVVNRTPLTPKIAGKSSQPHQPVATPLTRRRTNDASTPSGGHNGGTVALPGSREDVTSPVSNFLGSNITPRSGSRQSRVDSANSTPTGTPVPERMSMGDVDRSLSHRHVVTFSPPSEPRSRQDAVDAKFFYASDARSGPNNGPQKPQSQNHHYQQQQQQQAQQPPLKSPTFMYANGSSLERDRSLGAQPVVAPIQEPQSSKFFYANGTPNLQPAFRPSSSASAAGSVVSSTSKVPAAKAPVAMITGPYGLARPSSPTKQPQLIQQQQLFQGLKAGTAITQQAVARQQVTSPLPLGPTPPGKRRVSIETSPRSSMHLRAESLGSGDARTGDALVMSKFMAAQISQPSQSAHTSQPASEATSPALLPTQNPAMTMASIIQAAEDFATDESEESKGQSELQSPTKSLSGDPLSDLVANARRERKVQDLEITNASLEAINRSLERQLRKQTAELRRFRRLSRSGRLSLTSMPPSRVPSDSTVGNSATMEGIGGFSLSDLSEEDDGTEGFDNDDEDDSMYDSDPSDADSSATPGAGIRAADRRRKRDEQRLQLDLSKHRELLVDSQKINQSIKRCLNWTEELIKEGKKALEYNVRVSDIDLPQKELPPRVLPPQYLLEAAETEQSRPDGDDESTADTVYLAADEYHDAEPLDVLSGGIGREDVFTARPALAVAASDSSAPQLWGKEGQDRDSGVEMSAEGEQVQGTFQA